MNDFKNEDILKDKQDHDKMSWMEELHMTPVCQVFTKIIIFFRTCKYVHGSSETKSAVEPLQVESVDRLLEHLSFGC